MGKQKIMKEEIEDMKKGISFWNIPYICDLCKEERKIRVTYSSEDIEFLKSLSMPRDPECIVCDKKKEAKRGIL